MRGTAIGIVVLACFATAAWIAWLRRDAPVDDAWIYLRYARNLIEGHGWVYNIGEPVNAATSQLNTLLLAGFGAMLGSLVVSQVIVFTLGSGGAAACALLAIEARHGSFAGIAAAATILGAPLLHTTYGLDSVLLLLGVSAAWCAWVLDRPVVAALAVGFAALVRPDGALVAPALLVDHVWRRRSLRSLPWRRMVLAFTVVVGPWAVFSLVEFGTVAPSSLAAKQAQLESGWSGFGPFWRGARHSLEWFDGRGLGIDDGVFLAVLLVGSTLAVFTRHSILPVLLWAGAECVGYSMLGVPYYHWYAAPLHFAFALVVAMLCALPWSSHVVGRSTAVVLLGGYLWLSLPPFVRLPPSYSHYRAAAAWICDHTGPDASIGAVEIGCLGYFAWPRPIVDACGLVAPQGVPSIARGEFGWWLETRDLDLIVTHEPPWPDFETEVLDDPRVAEQYEAIEPPAAPGIRIDRRR